MAWASTYQLERILLPRLAHRKPDRSRKERLAGCLPLVLVLKPPLAEPVLQPQPRNPPEVIQIVRDQDQTLGEGMGGDLGVHAPDRLPSSP